MNINFTEYFICTLGNERLQFENCSLRVEEFISQRAKYYGASHAFCNNLASLEQHINGLLKAPPTGIKYLVITDVMNPFCDFSLLKYMGDALSRNGATLCYCEGAVPGTEVDLVISIENHKGATFSISCIDKVDSIKVSWESQAQYNNQLNLYKYKRLKLFLTLLETSKEIHTLSIPELMKHLVRDDIFSILASFGNKVRMVEYSKCPHCHGKLNPLINTMSQPFCGYLPVERPLYHECDGCGLVVQSPSIHGDDIHTVYDKWDKQDFIESINNPYVTDSIRCNFTHIIPELPPQTRTLDLGGGMGGFSKFLKGVYPNWVVTHSDFEIKASAPEGVNSRVLDFTNNSIGKKQYDLITAWEVIEHVPYEKLSFVLKNIYEALSNDGFFIFSTPDFDSPLCKSFDFYAACPPFHYVVYGKKWLMKFFLDSQEFEVVNIRHCSDFLDDALNWYAYGAESCPSLAMRNTSYVLYEIFKNDKNNYIKHHLSNAGMGTELVMTLRKKIKK
jgi:2-polyprenyl-3-methyl-5-hydroxy-6-metoxy-1,4-benzoquinol methylase